MATAAFPGARFAEDRASEANKNDAELRENRLVQEVTGLGILDKNPD